MMGRCEVSRPARISSPMKVLYQSQGYLPPGLLLVGEGPLRQQHEELARSRHARTEFSGLSYLFPSHPLAAKGVLKRETDQACVVGISAAVHVLLSSSSSHDEDPPGNRTSRG